MISQQRAFFETGKTKSFSFRLQQLQQLKQLVVENTPEIIQALHADLRKPELEAYATEISMVSDEINYALNHLKSWMKPRQVSTPLVQLPGTSQIYSEPLGVVLIIAPWNYPFQLVMTPLVGAIAAGNCVIIKPSELAIHTSNLISKLLFNSFDPSFISVIEGGKETTQKLLEESFDRIFFTGGTEVGKIVMSAAAKHLTPVTLELGGKSPCIVDADTHLDYTTKRIIWGKFLNAGQTCTAPDYLLVHKDIKEALIDQMKKCLNEFYGNNPATSPDYARIINLKHHQRLCRLLNSGKIIVGGETNAEDLYIAPTLLDGMSEEAEIEEIFGPILPIVGYNDLEEAIAFIKSKPKPLALYFFSNNKHRQQRILQETSSGSVCINDTVVQVASTTLPFGGVGASGMGRYRGQASFETFSHQKSVMKKGFLLDLKLRYAPYAGKLPILKRLLG